MSVQAMQWARGMAPNATSQLVLFGLADHSDPAGITYVGQKTLAGDCSCSERAVRTNMVRLERGGLIARVRRSNRRGYRSSDWVILAPRQRDRGSMLDVDDDQVAQRRYPEDVAWLAQTITVLPEPDAVREPDLPEPPAARHQALPAPPSIPTGTSVHSYRQIVPSLAAPGAGEQLVEQSVNEPIPKHTAACAAPGVDEVADGDGGEGETGAAEKQADYSNEWLQVRSALKGEPA